MRVFMVAIALIGLVSAVALASDESQKADDVPAAVVAENNGNTDEVEGAVMAQNEAVEAVEAPDEVVEAAEAEDEAVAAEEAQVEAVEDEEAQDEAVEDEATHNEVDDEEQVVEEEEQEQVERPRALEELLSNEANPGYKVIEQSLLQADDDKEVVNGVTAGELRYDLRDPENVKLCNMESFKARLALCDRTKTNFTANVFCRRTIRNQASMCVYELYEKITNPTDKEFVDGLEVELAISNGETEGAASFNYMGHETRLEEYIRGLREIVAHRESLA